MRYVGQGFEVETALPPRLSEGCVPDLEARFDAAYAARFGAHLENQRVEAVNWRIEGYAPAPPTPLRSVGAGGAGGAAARTRRAYFPDLEDFVDTPVLRESALTPGAWRDGPALIEQAGSTVVVGPGDRFRMDEAGNIAITPGARTGHGA
jgi:N-methylhydantoinase A